MSYDIVRKGIHDLILANVECDAEVKEYLRLEMRHTDTFHTDLFHDASDSCDVEELLVAYDTVCDEIAAHFADRMNFHPGYVPVSIKTKPSEDIPYGEFEAIFGK